MSPKLSFRQKISWRTLTSRWKSNSWTISFIQPSVMLLRSQVNRWTGEPGRSESNGVRLKAKQQCGSTEKSPKRKCSFQKSQKRYCILHVSSFIHTLDISGCLTLSCCTLGSVSGSHLISSQSLPPSQQLNAKTRLARRAKKNTAYRETLYVVLLSFNMALTFCWKTQLAMCYVILFVHPSLTQWLQVALKHQGPTASS